MNNNSEDELNIEREYKQAFHVEMSPDLFKGLIHMRYYRFY